MGGRGNLDERKEEQMNLFELPSFNWWKYMEQIMENVNLSEFSMLQNNHLMITFSNSCNGEFYRKLSCSQVLKCCIENDAFENEQFDYFVADVYLKKLSPIEVGSSLKYYKYGYNLNPFQVKELYLISIIGNVVCIDIICGKIEIITNNDKLV